MHEAALRGDLDEVKRLLYQGKQVPRGSPSSQPHSPPNNPDARATKMVQSGYIL